MSTANPSLNTWRLGTLLRGEPEMILAWVRGLELRRVLFYTAFICAGTGCYGAAVGAWRDPLQGLYTAIKFPLLILLTTLGNALLNGMLAPLLGVNINFRTSLKVIFMSFIMAASILGALSPILFFVVWNTPPPPVRGLHSYTSLVAPEYSFMQLTTTAGIAFAGVVANVRMFPLLRTLGGSNAAAWRVLLAWLAGNLLLGSQLCWVFRPFIGNPRIPVEFLTTHPFEGNFFEAVYQAVRHLLFS